MGTGLLILSGLIVFVVAEKLFSVITKLTEAEEELEVDEQNNEKRVKKSFELEKTDRDNKKHVSSELTSTFDRPFSLFIFLPQITGYLNLFANAIDNFTHGLSLGGAFLVSFRLGCLTTFAILMHEVPHEVGDFAILLKSGFSRWDAAKFQIITAGGGLVGSMASLFFSGASNAVGK